MAESDDRTVDYIKLSLLGGQLAEAAQKKNDAEIHKVIKAITARPIEKKMSDEVRAWVEEEITRDFTLRDAMEHLGITPRDKALQANLRKILSRMKKEGAIRQGDRAGFFTRVEEEPEEFEWWDASTKDLPIILNFQAHDYVKIYPGNIIVYAGAPNAGKTAAILRMIVENLSNKKLFEFYKVWMEKGEFPDVLFHLYNSEAGPEEFKSRIGLIDDLDEAEFIKRVRVFARTSDFAEVIHPNLINFVDFMELHDNFFLISKYFTEIHNKLDKGIAVVALQKNKDQEYGLGQGRGLEKPRLYCTFDSNKYTIVKAKNWKTGKNPNYLGTTYQLIGGNKFIYSPLTRQDPPKVRMR